MGAVLVAINAKYSHTNLAVRYLRAVLAAADIPCGVAEYTINQPDRVILADLVRRKPDQILFSCYLWNIDLVRRLGGDLRALFPNARILLGGPEVSFSPWELLPDLPFADAILCGEGEGTVVKALQDNPIQKVYEAQEYTNLDSLPFPYDDLDSLQNRVLYYESTRGCPFGCAYCLSSADRKLRRRPLPLVFDDLRRFLEARVMRVKFVDRTFNLEPDRATAVWEYLMDHDNGVTGFQMELGGDLLTPGQIALLSKARPGLFQFEIGVQSTDGPTLETVCRKTDLPRLRTNVLALRRAGNIHCHLDLIAGLPGEGYERFLQSYDDVFSLRPEQLQLGFLKLLRGSALWQARDTYGLRFSRYAPYEVLETPSLSFPELARLKRLEEMTETYYNSGRFSLALSFLLERTDSPARFFLELADTLPDAAPGKYVYYDLIYDYGRSLLDPQEAETLRWLIRADLCLHERPRKLPRCVPEGIRPKGAREIPKAAHAEVFPFDFRSPGGPHKPVLAVFDYERRTLSGRAEIRVTPWDGP